MIWTFIDIALLGFLVIIAVAVIRLRNLFATVMLFSIYSLVSASLFLTMDAADVAFTEAAVGAGISTVLMLATLALTDHRERGEHRERPLRLLLVIVTGAILVWGTLDLPRFADPEAPAHMHVAPRYIEASPAEVGIPNMVASVLASYRGYDTMGETVVIFTAGLGLMVLLGGRRKRKDRDR